MFAENENRRQEAAEHAYILDLLASLAHTEMRKERTERDLGWLTREPHLKTPFTFVRPRSVHAKGGKFSRARAKFVIAVSVLVEHICDNDIHRLGIKSRGAFHPNSIGALNLSLHPSSIFAAFVVVVVVVDLKRR